MTDATTIISQQFKMWRQEIDDGFDAYGNALAVRRCYNRYGRTERFREYISTEGIISTVGDAISKFIAWVRKKIGEIIQKIRQFFHNLKVRIFKFLGIRTGGSGNDAKDVANTIRQMNVVRDKDRRPPAVLNKGTGISKESSSVKLPGGCKIEGDSYYMHWMLRTIEDYTKLLRGYGILVGDNGLNSEEFNEEFVTYKTLTSPNGGETKAYSYARSDIQQSCEHIAGWTTYATTDCDTLTINMDRYSKEIDQYLKDVEHQDAHDADLKRAISTLTHGTRFNERYWNNDNLTGSLTDKHKQILKLSTELIENQSKLAYCASKFLAIVDRVYNAGVKAVHVILPVDRQFANDLRDYIVKKFNLSGGEFNPRNIIITNVDPSTWCDEGDVSNGTSGWTFGDSGSVGAKDIYVNYRFYKALFEDPNVSEIKLSQTVLATVVHEATHLFDMQNDQDLDDTVEYWFRPHEMRARQVSNTFVVTKEHTKWITEVVHQVQKLTGVR